MKLSLKYSLLGCGALAVLSLVQWARPLSASAEAPVRHLLGVLPLARGLFSRVTPR